MKPFMRLVAVLGLISVPGLAAVWLTRTADAQGAHPDAHPVGESLSPGEQLAGISHGVTLGATVFLAGLVAFAALVWLPASRAGVDDQEKAANLFCRWMWALIGVLAVAWLVEIPVYAVRASGETLSFGLLGEAFFSTRVGQIWLVRLALGILTAAAAMYAAQRLRRPAYWWVAVVVAFLLLMTLTQQSHAAAEGRLLPFVSDWLHLVAASVWMGGLLGFPLLLIGPLRAVPIEARGQLLGRTVRRFSKVATVAVMVLIISGLYAILLHVPSLPALLETPYGRALIMKLGLLVVLLAAGGINLRDRGQGLFGRMVGAELILAVCILVATGFLTSLPPADAEQPIEENVVTPSQTAP